MWRLKYFDISVLVSLILIMKGSEAGDVTQWAATGITNPPAGALATFSVSKAEDLSVTTAIITLTATASIAITGYSIIDQPNAGQLEVTGTTIGEVSLATGKSFDRETQETIVIKVKAVAGSTDSGTATITITVTDVNEMTPTFSKPSTSSKSVVVNDKTKPSTTNTVYQVAATDTDATGTTITYAISSGNTNTDFAIAASTGKITVAKQLKMATTAEYALVVHAIDAGTPKKTGIATIRVVVWACSGTANLVTNFSCMFVALFLTLFRLV